MSEAWHALLSETEALKALEPPVLMAIAKAAELVRYAPQQVVVAHQEESSDCYIILQGQVRIGMTSETGRKLTYQVLQEGQIFGEIAAVDGLPRIATVTAETPVQLARLQQQQFATLVAEEPSFARVVLSRLTQLNRRLAQQLFEAHSYRIEGRLAIEILRLAEQADGHGIRITDQDMASRVGSNRTYVNHSLKDLSKQGLIRRERSMLTVLDPDGLRQRIERSKTR